MTAAPATQRAVRYLLQSSSDAVLHVLALRPRERDDAWAALFAERLPELSLQERARAVDWAEDFRSQLLHDVVRELLALRAVVARYRRETSDVVLMLRALRRGLDEKLAGHVEERALAGQ